MHCTPHWTTNFVWYTSKLRVSHNIANSSMNTIIRIQLNIGTGICICDSDVDIDVVLLSEVLVLVLILAAL